MIISVEIALREITAFHPNGDDLAAKSQDLVSGLLQYSESPFSRHQFTPGHITCTALVLHPTERAVLLMYHHRLNRWLLPGGHVEPDDLSLHHAAAREAMEETRVQLSEISHSVIAGIDVHGIPRRSDEPYHLHHDLLWAFQAASDRIETTEEAPLVRWATEDTWAAHNLSENICRAARRTFRA